MSARLVLAAVLVLRFGPACGAEHLLPGRLFYTPDERTMLVNARLHKITELRKTEPPPDTAVITYDGVVLRSDGRDTHWVNGQVQRGRSSPVIRNLKPGQIRADKKTYEPYQVVRPDTAAKPALTTPPSETLP
jgi:hypothetical protein